MEYPIYKEIFEGPRVDFKNYLEDVTNEKIFFSGKYGIGKTSFLENFFSDENQNEMFSEKKFEVFRISPVEYSIASNQDIINFIKYDIIYQLLFKNKIIQDIPIDRSQIVNKYLKKNYLNVFACLIRMIPSIGKDVIGAFEYIDKQKKELFDYIENESKSNSDKLIEFMNVEEGKTDSLFANDIITDIINESLSKDKFNSILLIDDLDRLDPEHVFRILNVFSIHLNSIDTNQPKRKSLIFNKFIFIADIENLRNIYTHRFGPNTDFQGYIDKFYSKDVYDFDNVNMINGVITKIFKSIKFTQSNLNYLLDNNNLDSHFLSFIVSELLTQKLLSLRNLMKPFGKLLDYNSNGAFFKEIDHVFFPDQYPFFIQLKFLRYLYADFSDFRFAMQKFVISNYFLKRNECLGALMIFITNVHIHKFEYKNFVFELDQEKYLFQFSQQRGPDKVLNAKFSRYIDTNSGPSSEIDNVLRLSILQFKNLFLNCIDILNLNGYLR